jgi:toxin YoeB
MSVAFADFCAWMENDRKIGVKIKKLIKEIERTPFGGTGKPEPLKHELSGYWSRRITSEHRLVYKVEKDMITIISCKDHYLDE